MKKIILMCSTVLVFLAFSAQAQTFTKPEKAIEIMMLEGKAIEAFIPKGWEIYSEAKGDLNGDGLADAAISIGLTEDMKEMLDTSENNYESPPYIVAVLFAKRGGGFRRFAVNGKLFPKYGDAPPSLTIAKGVLITNQNFRDGWAVDATYRFRYNADASKLMLIGFDLEHYSRGNIYEGNKVSENYLTGTRIEYAKSSNNRKSSVYSETKKSRIPRSIVYFEETRFIEGDDNADMVRPF